MIPSEDDSAQINPSDDSAQIDPSNFNISLLIDLSVKKRSSSSLVLSPPPPPPPFPSLDICKIIQIQNIFRKSRVYRKLKIVRKKRIYRFFVLSELFKTEKELARNLKLIIHNVKVPSSKILDPNDIKTIFSEIESIELLSTEISNYLEKKLHDFDENTMIAEKMLEFIPHFKMYFKYCQNFNSAHAFYEKLRKKDAGFRSLLDKLDYTEELNFIDFPAQIIKPIQRLPKYVLLFKDLLKNTEENHPDHVYIAEILEKFQELNNLNNSGMEQHLKQTKLLELQEVHGNPNKIDLLAEKNAFLGEETLNYVVKGIPMPGICYFLSKSLLIVKRLKDAMALVSYIELDSHSFIKKIPNLTYYRNIFAIYGRNGSITVSCENEESRRNIMQVTQEIIEKLRINHENNKSLMKAYKRGNTDNLLMESIICRNRVEVVGTLHRGYKEFFNAYVVEISGMGEERTCYFRYSELIRLEETIRRIYPNTVICHLNKDFWFNSCKARTIEHRKILIENFLQSILCSPTIFNENEKLFKIFGLYPSKKTPLDMKEDFEKERAFYIKRFGLYSVFAILNELLLSEKKKVLKSCENQEEPQYDVIIKLMDDSLITIKVNRNITSLDLIRLISTKINLYSYLDFKLFTVNYLKEDKPLEDEELILKTLEMDFLLDEPESPVKNSVFSKLKTNFFGNSKKSPFFSDFHLLFKKYFFLPQELEIKDLNRDYKKLELLSHQIFKEAFSLKYLLSNENYALLAAMRLFLAHKKNKITFLSKEIRQILPSAVMAREKSGFWEHEILKNINSLDVDSSQLIQIDLRESHSRKCSVSIDHKVATFLKLYDFISKIDLFGAKLFWVSLTVQRKDEKSEGSPTNREKEPCFRERSRNIYEEDSRNTLNMIKDIALIKNSQQYLWFNIEYGQVSFLNDKKETIWSCKNEKIVDFCCYPLCLFVECESIEIKINSVDSFEMFQLMNVYVKMKRMISQWRKKSFVAMKTENGYD